MSVDERHRHRPARRLHVAQADPHRELGVVLPATRQVEADAHRASARLREEPHAVPRVGAADALGQQDGEGLAQRLVALGARRGLAPLERRVGDLASLANCWAARW
jgi:hypothetical protein